MLSTCSSSDVGGGAQKSSLQIIQDDKFYHRLLSKESSNANPSFRVYYGVASGAVPFVWESQPGTPKNSLPTTALPPLTPPPSYQSTINTPKNHHHHHHPSSKSNLFINIILPRLTLKKTRTLPSSPSTSSSTASSSSCSFSPLGSHHSRSNNCYHGRSSFSSSMGTDDDEEGLEDGSPTSIFCFRSPMRRRGGRGRGGGLFGGCYGMVAVKKKLLSIVCHGSN